ncbi:MAG: hypothetical protein KKA42_01285 [candidate division Zixibacteria bacterium]|nr:hypothetical protein [candidate division Zixibacteria bacterium]
MSRRLELTGQAERTEAYETELPGFGEQLINLFRRVFKARRWIVGAVVAVMAVTAIVVYLMPNHYRSTATILPAGKADQLAELKNLAGLGSTSADDNSSELFPVILASRLVRNAVLETEYRIVDDGAEKRINLPEYFGSTIPDRLHRKLADISTITTDPKTRVITIAVETEYPTLSQAIVAEYLRQLEDYNLNKRRSQAQSSAAYLSVQVDQCRAALTELEDDLQAFQEVNRNWAATSDPEITTTLARFRREIELKTQAYLFLSQQLEASHLDEQKDTPVIRLLDEPSVPMDKSGPFRKSAIAISGLIALAFILLGILIYDVTISRMGRAEALLLSKCRDELKQGYPRTARIILRREDEPVG